MKHKIRQEGILLLRMNSGNFSLSVTKQLVPLSVNEERIGVALYPAAIRESLSCPAGAADKGERFSLLLKNRLFRSVQLQELLQLCKRIGIYFRLHRAELRTAHRAELGGLIDIGRQGFVVILFGPFRV
jgi:hypothetical protein